MIMELVMIQRVNVILFLCGVNADPVLFGLIINIIVNLSDYWFHM